MFCHGFRYVFSCLGSVLCSVLQFFGDVHKRCDYTSKSFFFSRFAPVFKIFCVYLQQ